MSQIANGDSNSVNDVNIKDLLRGLNEIPPESQSDNSKDPTTLFKLGPNQVSLISHIQKEKVLDAIMTDNVHDLKQMQLDILDLNFDVNNVGFTPFMIACARGSQVNFTHSARIPVIETLLINKRININKKDKNGANAYWLAAFFGHVQVLQILDRTGAKFDRLATNHINSNSLHISCKRGHLENVRYLISTKYPLDDLNVHGATPIAIAAFKGYPRIVDELSRARADINKTSNLGIGPMFLAVGSGNVQMCEMLYDLGAYIYYNDTIKKDYSPMFYAIRKGFFEAVRMFIQKGCDIYQKNISGFTPFTYSAYKEQYKITDLLSMHTKTIDREDSEYLTVTFRVILKSRFKLADRLLQRGSNINYTNRLGFTGLHLALEVGDIKAVKYMLSKGANPHIEDLTGEDSCDKAIKSNLTQIPELNYCQAHLRQPAKLPQISNENASGRIDDVISKGLAGQAKMSDLNLTDNSVMQIEKPDPEIIDENDNIDYFKLYELFKIFKPGSDSKKPKTVTDDDKFDRIRIGPVELDHEPLSNKIKRSQIEDMRERQKLTNSFYGRPPSSKSRNGPNQTLTGEDKMFYTTSSIYAQPLMQKTLQAPNGDMTGQSFYSLSKEEIHLGMTPELKKKQMEKKERQELRLQETKDNFNALRKSRQDQYEQEQRQRELFEQTYENKKYLDDGGIDQLLQENRNKLMQLSDFKQKSVHFQDAEKANAQQFEDDMRKVREQQYYNRKAYEQSKLSQMENYKLLDDYKKKKANDKIRLERSRKEAQEALNKLHQDNDKRVEQIEQEKSKEERDIIQKQLQRQQEDDIVDVALSKHIIKEQVEPERMGLLVQPQFKDDKGEELRKSTIQNNKYLMRHFKDNKNSPVRSILESPFRSALQSNMASVTVSQDNPLQNLNVIRTKKKHNAKVIEPIAKFEIPQLPSPPPPIQAAPISPPKVREDQFVRLAPTKPLEITKTVYEHVDLPEVDNVLADELNKSMDMIDAINIKLKKMKDSNDDISIPENLIQTPYYSPPRSPPAKEPQFGYQSPQEEPSEDEPDQESIEQMVEESENSEPITPVQIPIPQPVRQRTPEKQPPPPPPQREQQSRSPPPAPVRRPGEFMLRTMDRAVQRDQSNQQSKPHLRNPLSENRSNKVLYYRNGGVTDMDRYRTNTPIAKRRVSAADRYKTIDQYESDQKDNREQQRSLRAKTPDRYRQLSNAYQPHNRNLSQAQDYIKKRKRVEAEREQERVRLQRRL